MAVLIEGVSVFALGPVGVSTPALVVGDAEEIGSPEVEVCAEALATTAEAMIEDEERALPFAS
jgi:hypothetical protein